MVRDVLQQANNYFSDIEAAADAFVTACAGTNRMTIDNAMERLTTYADSRESA